MKDIISAKRNKIIDKIAQFLLINSEAIPQKGLNGKIPLIYFLFAYGNTFSKTHYTEFAFEILENILIEELSDIENHKYETNSEISGIGWGLINFIKNDYFESDDLEDILSMVDKAVFLEVERLSRTDFKTSYFIQLISIGLYLKERVSLLSKSNKIKVLEINEYLLITFFELTTNIDHLVIKKLEMLGLCKSFFNDCINHDIVAHFCVDGLKKINQLTPKDNNKKVVEYYTYSMEREKFETIIAYNLLFSDLVEEGYELDLLNSIKNNVNKIMINLYQKNNNEKVVNLLSLMMYGISMINYEEGIKERSFEFYLIMFLVNFVDNE